MSSLLFERSNHYDGMGYARASTMQQNEDRQIVELSPLVTTESYFLVEKRSGKDFDRPIHRSLKNITREGDTLVIKSLDRLGRNYEQMKEEWEGLSYWGNLDQGIGYSYA